jgi:hypothetical protein
MIKKRDTTVCSDKRGPARNVHGNLRGKRSQNPLQRAPVQLHTSAILLSTRSSRDLQVQIGIFCLFVHFIVIQIINFSIGTSTRATTCLTLPCTFPYRSASPT